jgi:Tfp pilus assembly protein PilF
VLVVVAGGLLAFAGSLDGEFHLDDVHSIVENPTIRQIGVSSLLLHPLPKGSTVSGRPVLNASFMVDYAVAGLDLRQFHRTNLAIHLAAALVLLGLVRRGLRAATGQASPGIGTTMLAGGIALLWVVHPLQTESVTYIVQRAESLGGLFFLLTLYASVRAFERERSFGWQATACLACALGAGTKEVVITALPVVLLLDRALFSSSWSLSWRARRGFLLALALSAVPGLAVALATGGRGGTAGLASGVDPFQYALTQAWAIPHYLGLVFWPSNLVFDYGTPVVSSLREVAPHVALMAILLAGTAWALLARPRVGFLPAAFFIVLAPSSSVLPVATQTVAEHRMYLPLAAVVIGVVLTVAWGASGLVQRLGLDGARASAAAACVVLAFLALAAIALAVTTAARNRVYASEMALWQDTVVKMPTNPRAFNGRGLARLEAGQCEGALEDFDSALQLAPAFELAINNRGLALVCLHRPVEALRELDRVLRLNPRFGTAYHNRARCRLLLGDLNGAREDLRLAVRNDFAPAPDLLEALGGTVVGGAAR